MMGVVDLFEVTLLIGTCFLVNYVTADAKTNWAEGTVMIAFYLMIVRLLPSAIIFLPAAFFSHKISPGFAGSRSMVLHRSAGDRDHECVRGDCSSRVGHRRSARRTIVGSGYSCMPTFNIRP